MLNGTDELLGRLRTLAVRLEREAAPAAVNAGLEVLAAGVRARTPVRTGALLAAEVVTDPSDRRGYVSGSVSVTSDHVAAVEFGTGRQAAEPFLRPAFEQDSPAAAEAVARTLGSSLEALTS